MEITTELMAKSHTKQFINDNYDNLLQYSKMNFKHAGDYSECNDMLNDYLVDFMARLERDEEFNNKILAILNRGELFKYMCGAIRRQSSTRVKKRSKQLKIYDKNKEDFSEFNIYDDSEETNIVENNFKRLTTLSEEVEKTIDWLVSTNKIKKNVKLWYYHKVNSNLGFEKCSKQLNIAKSTLYTNYNKVNEYLFEYCEMYRCFEENI